MMVRGHRQQECAGVDEVGIVNWILPRQTPFILAGQPGHGLLITLDSRVAVAVERLVTK